MKFFLLLILFLFNFVTTAVADSHHLIENETSTGASLENHVHDNSSAGETEHCDDDSCHTGHYHHFLQSSFTFQFSTYQFSLSFSESTQRVPSTFFDVIKPPLTLS